MPASEQLTLSLASGLALAASLFHRRSRLGRGVHEEGCSADLRAFRTLVPECLSERSWEGSDHGGHLGTLLPPLEVSEQLPVFRVASGCSLLPGGAL